MNATARWEKELADQVRISTEGVWRRAKTLLVERDEARHWAGKMLVERDVAMEGLNKTVAFTKRMVAERDEARERAEEKDGIVERALTMLEDIQDIMEGRYSA